MPRRARLDAPGTLHHVMIRGIEGSAIFKDDQDRQDPISRTRDEPKDAIVDFLLISFP
jgi:hypothetical protein